MSESNGSPSTGPSDDDGPTRPLRGISRAYPEWVAVEEFVTDVVVEPPFLPIPPGTGREDRRPG